MYSDDGFSYDASAQDLNRRRAPVPDYQFPLQRFVRPENTRQAGQWGCNGTAYPATQELQSPSFGAGVGVVDTAGRTEDYGQRYSMAQEDRSTVVTQQTSHEQRASPTQQYYTQEQPASTYPAPTYTAPAPTPALQTSPLYTTPAYTTSVPAAQTSAYYQPSPLQRAQPLAHQWSGDSPGAQTQAQQRTNVGQGFQQTTRVDQSYQYASQVQSSAPAASQQQQQRSVTFPQAPTRQVQDTQSTARLALLEHERQEQLKLLLQQQLQRGQQLPKEREQQHRELQLQKEKEQQLQRDQDQREREQQQQQQRVLQLQTEKEQQFLRDQDQREQQLQREQQWAIEKARHQASIVQPPASLSPPTPPASSRPQQGQAKPPTPALRSESLPTPPVVTKLQKPQKPEPWLYLPEPAKPWVAPGPVVPACGTHQAPQNLPQALQIALQQRQQAAVPPIGQLATPNQPQALRTAQQPQQVSRLPRTQAPQAQHGVATPPQRLPTSDAAVLSAAAAAYHLTKGVSVPVETIRQLLRSSNDFNAMCAYFDTLGHAYDRGALARYMIAALEQAKKGDYIPAVPISPLAPIPQPVGPDKILGEVEGPFRRQQTPAAIYQQAPYGVPARPSPLPQVDQAGWSGHAGNTLRGVRNEKTPQSNSAAVQSAAAQPKREVPTVGHSPLGHFATALPRPAPPPPPPPPPPLNHNIVMLDNSPSPPAAFDDFGLLEMVPMDIDSHSPSSDGGQVHNNSTALPGPGAKSPPKTTSAVNGDTPLVIDLMAGQTGSMQRPPEFTQPLAEAISRRNAARVSKYDPATIARDILIIARKHLTERGLNDHLLPLKDNLGIDWGCDLSTIRWDLIDPDPITLDDANGDDEMDGGGCGGIIAPWTPSISKKRARNRSRRSAPGGQATKIIGNTNAAPAPHTAQPIDIDSRSMSPTAPMDSEKPAKRRRTSGAVNAFTPSNVHTSRFRRFSCKWKDCNAELHNLDNLRRHLLTHKQGSISGSRFTCHWLGCARPLAREHKAMTDDCPPISFDFASEQEWGAHLEGHIDAVKQSLGMGPAVLQSDQESGVSDFDYLSDHTGQQITPIASAAKPFHTFVPPPGFLITKHFKIAHGISLPKTSRVTSATQRRLLDRYAKMGAGMSGDEIGDLLDTDWQGPLENARMRIVKGPWPKPT